MKIRARLVGCLGVVIWLSAVLTLGVAAQDNKEGEEFTRRQRQALAKVDEEIAKAERLHESERHDNSAKSLIAAVRLWQESQFDLTAAYHQALLNRQTKLELLRTKLNASGQQIPELPDLPPPIGAVLFREQVVPILVSKCGDCHVTRARGQFSMATYEELTASPHLVAGQPAASRMLLAIETGEMPQGNVTVTAEELEILKAWVKQGAKSNLENNRQNLRELTGQGQNNPAMTLEIKRPAGNETVSFANQIAPILIENCTGCHIDARQPRGGLNMTNFAGFLRGGDNGLLIKPGDPENSMIVKKLLGTGGGNRMPQGREPLPNGAIELVKKWIEEGATFDGIDGQTAVRVIAAKSRAERSNHEELAASRLDLAKRNWAKTLPKSEPIVVVGDDVQIVGNLDESDLQKIAKQTNALVKELKAALKAPEDEPLVKGKITMFVMRQRFDFNEFGVMVLGHPIPRDVKQLWQFDDVDARVALLWSPSDQWEQQEVNFARQLATVYMAAQTTGVPRWFAEGAGQLVVAKKFSKSDQVKQWELLANQAVGQLTQGANQGSADAMEAARVQNLQAMLEGRLPEEQLGQLGYYFVTQMRTNSRAYSKLLAAIKEADSFEAAFAQAYGQTLQQYFRLPQR